MLESISGHLTVFSAAVSDGEQIRQPLFRSSKPLSEVLNADMATIKQALLKYAWLMGQEVEEARSSWRTRSIGRDVEGMVDVIDQTQQKIIDNRDRSRWPLVSSTISVAEADRYEQEVAEGQKCADQGGIFVDLNEQDWLDCFLRDPFDHKIEESSGHPDTNQTEETDDEDPFKDQRRPSVVEENSSVVGENSSLDEENSSEDEENPFKDG